jgi:2-iminobutanoate/2-iminopropanoate deaminase
LFLSGQIGMDRHGNLSADPIQQFQTALTNIDPNLTEPRMKRSDVIKPTLYLAGSMDPGERRSLLNTWLGGNEPTMTLLYVSALADPQIKVEIEAIACVDSA